MFTPLKPLLGRSANPVAIFDATINATFPSGAFAGVGFEFDGDYITYSGSVVPTSPSAFSDAGNWYKWKPGLPVPADMQVKFKLISGDIPLIKYWDGAAWQTLADDTWQTLASGTPAVVVYNFSFLSIPTTSVMEGQFRLGTGPVFDTATYTLNSTST